MECSEFRNKKKTTVETRCIRRTVATHRHITSPVQKKLKYRNDMPDAIRKSQHFNSQPDMSYHIIQQALNAKHRAAR